MHIKYKRKHKWKYIKIPDEAGKYVCQKCELTINPHDMNLVTKRRKLPDCKEYLCNKLLDE